MPSAYTEKLYNGEQDFKDFVLRTARGMGALIHMRDSSFDSPITLPEVSSYHRDRLEEAQQQLKKYESYTDEQWEAERDESYEEDFKRWREVEDKKNAREARYNDMIKKVNAWKAPTLEHTNFKKFMIDQLTESRNFDCHSLRRPVLMPVQDYKQDRLNKVLSDVTYHSEKYSEEIERVNERRKWIQQLIDSLEGI